MLYRKVYFTLRRREADAESVLSGSSLSYTPLNSLSASAQTAAADDADDDENAELMRGRISSANLYLMGPVTSERAYAVVSGRDEIKKAAEKEAEEKKKVREKEKEFKLAELRSVAADLDPQSAGDLSKLTIPKMQGLLLRDDGHRWADHSKLKGKKELLAACMPLYGFSELLLIGPAAGDAALMPPALMPPACLCPHPSVCDE